MIATSLKNSTHFMGQLDPEKDLVGQLRHFCLENGIQTAWISVTALLKNPIFHCIPESEGPAPYELEGTHFFPCIAGNVSLREDVVVLQLYTSLNTPEGMITGRLDAAEVVMAQFFLLSSDEIVLLSQSSEPLASWEQIQAPASHDFIPPPSSTIPFSTHPRLSPEEAEINELNILEIRLGDFLDHARFGLCEVVRVPRDEKVTVRLPTKKLVDLHLGVMNVSPVREVDGRRIFSLKVRRK